MNYPRVDASEREILEFARAWVRLAATEGLEKALASLDTRPDSHCWTQADFENLTFDHFDDGKQPVITDPGAISTLRVDAYPYRDGSGYAVDHDLALDGKRSDFTAQFEFRKSADRYRVYLADIHIL